MWEGCCSGWRPRIGERWKINSQRGSFPCYSQVDFLRKEQLSCGSLLLLAWVQFVSSDATPTMIGAIDWPSPLNPLSRFRQPNFSWAKSEP